MNLGIQYNVKIDYLNNIIFNCGISIVYATENIKNTSADSESVAKGFAGYFIGPGYERRFEYLTLSIFGEIQYKFDRFVFKALDLSYGGTNINLGLRYYF